MFDILIYMLTIICGEDSISAYNYFVELKNKYRQDNYEIFEIAASDIENITSWMNDSIMLFSTKKVFFTEGLNKKISRKQNLKINEIIAKLIDDKNIEVYDFENEVSSYYLKFSKKVKIKEFKPSENIFKLQESIYPGNLKTFIQILNNIVSIQDQYFIFNMLTKYIRNLILIKNGGFDKKIAPWQLSKLKIQAAKWDIKKLINFYDGFYKIDLMQKTSSTPFDIKKSLEILACYYL
ncbi:MAG: hypothetical protein Fur009_3930 [Candidatus Microgenomates bacterium]